jgi:hypothetical protein
VVLGSSRQAWPDNLEYKVSIVLVDKVEGKRLRVCGKFNAVEKGIHNYSGAHVALYCKTA